MNLITDNWISVQCENGAISSIAPWQISERIDESPIIDTKAARPDFRGALVQFLIGLLQTAFAPADEREWGRLWRNLPAAEELKGAFSKVEQAFFFNDSSPSFMQDFDLPDCESKPIAGLLIEAPGGKTERDNLDLFIKRGRVSRLCKPCAALALFTLQTNAPAGGAGYRVGLRGGGPLTTLLLPEGDRTQSLWHKLWLNVIPQKEARRKLHGNWQLEEADAIFPWMGPTRTSERGTGRDTLPDDVNPYQMYWGMPRRIRLGLKKGNSGTCDLCGRIADDLVDSFRTRNHGVNYAGPFEHPLSPHNVKDAQPIPLHGQKGGVYYRDWLGITLGNEEKSQKPAAVVRHFLETRAQEIDAGTTARLWAFGYDMDNMKARCWYDATMPVFALPEDVRDQLQETVVQMIDAASSAAFNIRSQIRSAWYRRPKEIKGDFNFIDRAFWQETESAFYEVLSKLVEAISRGEGTEPALASWDRTLYREAMALFDRYALAGDNENRDLRRTVAAYNNLKRWLNKNAITKMAEAQ